MSVSKSFIILAGCALVGGLLALLYYQHDLRASVPQTPCTSIISDGQFFDDNHQPYTLNASISWWPDSAKITLYGLKRAENQINTVVKRTLTLNQVTQKNNIISGRVAAVDISPTDKYGQQNVILGAAGEHVMMMFKKLNEKSWLLMINDNWVLMCSSK